MTSRKPERPTASGLSVAQFNPPGDLQPETTYHWQVVASTQTGATAGPEWSFTTEVGPTVKVIGPVDRQSWLIGGQGTVHWKLALDAGTTVRIELWRDGHRMGELGTGFSASGEDLTAITVPDVEPGNDYRLRVVSIWCEQKGYPDHYAESGPLRITRARPAETSLHQFQPRPAV